MPKKLSSAGCLTKAFPTAIAVQPIWITDAVLANAFRRFTHTGRRHASNVPGPLEARKRASKRKSTSFAHASASPIPIDPALLFPNRSKDPWWQKKQEPTEPSLPTLIPKWLVSTPVSTPAPPPSLRAQFESSTCVEDVYKILASHTTDLRREPMTNDVFSLLLRPASRWTAEELANYLTDPELNPPGTTNHAQLVNFLCLPPDSGQVSVEIAVHWDILHQALCRAISLGLLDPPNIESIILAMPNIRLTNNAGDPMVRNRVDVWHEIIQLLKNLHNCGIFGIRDLSSRVRQTLSSEIAADVPSPTALELLKCLSEHTLDHGDSTLTLPLIVWLERHFCGISDGAQQVADYLLAVPRSSLPAILSAVTEVCFLNARDHHKSEAFVAWSEVLARVRTPGTSEDSFTREEMTLVRQAFSYSLTPLEATLTSFWVVGVYDDDGGRLSSIRRDDLGEELRKVTSLDSRERILEWLSEVVHALETLPLSGQQRAVFVTSRPLSASIRTMDTEPTSPMADPGTFIITGCARLANDLFYAAARKLFRHELVRMCEMMTCDLVQFVRVMQTLIQEDGKNFKVFTRLLRNNRIFRLGLAQARKDREQWRTVLMTENVVIVRAKPYLDGDVNLENGVSPEISHYDSLPSPKSLLDVINRIAIAVATSESITQTRAYNLVRTCWRLLRSLRAPISPVISRALWHAGITRRGPQGCSNAHFRWIWKTVKYAEGNEVAQFLLDDPVYRVYRKEMLETVAEDLSWAWRHVHKEVDHGDDGSSGPLSDDPADRLGQRKEELARRQCK
jgi:hypothetical protein